MSFWFDVLFDDDDVMLDDPQDLGDGFRVDVAKTEVQHWLERNSAMCDAARHLLKDYVEHHAHEPPGPLAPISPLAWNWLPQGSVKIRADDPRDRSQVESVWREDEKDKFEQDKTYARVSHEVDRWWEEQARDENYDDYAVEVPSVEYAQSRIESCKASYSNKYSHSFRPEDQGQPGEDFSRQEWGQDPDPNAARNFVQEYVDDLIEEGDDEEIVDDDEEDDDDDDDESYGEGPMTGLLTEVPNILDPKQIEALHMIVKSCICDTVGSGLARSGENLQETRCKMFLALDCGKSLLREILVFIAVWEKDEQSMIFEITTQIVRALHHNALVPYAWNCLLIPKDIISPA
ncbi:MAG: hypothetical protein OK454_08675, partial [Thaumarchaeota archaeon]|nr:hypothetical protein [Nitrososphaerota archaeon]